ncbi:hypothetical protein Taro_038194 [Colocasia esculenta]|uniref:ZCF37 n=1 Tax=Colocasia esculenta TaxID=4460 RepID=A0A843WN01_COLES|nr:hypothetical protein [Colocasia esculenta]
MFCGAGSFPREDGDPWSPPSPPRVPDRRQGRSSNPYSTRGLDKFSTVLADLQARREMITAKASEQGSPIVRFVYSNSDGCWVPIVVRRREQRPEPEKKPKKGATTESRKEPDAAAREEQSPPRMDAKGGAHAGPSANRALKKSSPGMAEGKEGSVFFRWDPSYYWPAVVVLILLCLAFGRTFAICCTSICWYSLPRTKVGENRNARKGVRKEYRRRASKRQLRAGGR